MDMFVPCLQQVSPVHARVAFAEPSSFNQSNIF
jgi:hypothetical protein